MKKGSALLENWIVRYKIGQDGKYKQEEESGNNDLDGE